MKHTILHLFTLLACTYILSAAEKPNVIIVLADDQGYGDLSVNGNPVLKTPHLDRLCEESVSFSDFHVAPMCTPTRGMLMAGIDAFRNGATGVASGMTTLRTDLPIAPQLFRKNGYRTALFGKWHLGDTYPYRPQDRGFEEVLSFNGSMIPLIANKFGDSYFNPTLLENGEWKKTEGYITDVFFDRAMSWMDKRAEAEEPFFVFLPTPTPHVPNQVDEKYAAPYRGKSYKGAKAHAEFYGMIANIDENMKRLDRFLEDKGLRENTILIYLSDNGTQSSTARKLYNAGMRGQKISVYDGGHRSPLFIRWPNGDLRHGSVINELATVQDILPTLVELCELKGIDAKFDGISIAEPLKDPSKEIPLRTVVNQYVIVWKDCTGKPWNSTCVMRGPWRMVSPTELYNIHDDPAQETNVASQYPDIVKQLSDDYRNWYSEAIKHHQRRLWLEAGGDAPNPMELTSIDWMGTCTDTWHHASRQKVSEGYYNIRINESGTYKIIMRHWPEESGQKLDEVFAQARLRISPPRAGKFDEHNKNKPVFEETLALSGKQQAVFLLELEAGEYEFAPDFLTEDGRFHKSALHLSIEQDKTSKGKAAVSVCEKENLDIYLLIGQSNMSGRGAIEKEQESFPERVFLLNAENVFEPASHPLNQYSTIGKPLHKQKLNIGYSFAKKMREAKPDASVGLIVNARGGTGIGQWKKGTPYYEEAIQRVREAQQYGVLKGILWHQGERNSGNPKGYDSALAQLIRDLRADLGIETLPFVAGQIMEKEKTKEINAMIAALPQNVEYTGFVSSKGLQTFEPWHFDTEAILALGEGYAQEMLRLHSHTKVAALAP